MTKEKEKLEYFQDILVNINGPVDQEIRSSAKYSDDEYSNLLENLYKYGFDYDITSVEKLILIDAFRICLEGIDDYEFGTVTGKSKIEFLKLFGDLLNDWGIQISKLRNNSYDSIDYQQKIVSTGLIENLK